MADSPLGDAIGAVFVDEAATNVAQTVRSKFEDAETGRYQHEQRWLKAYKNFRGIYDGDTQFRDSERSRVFLKITKTKVLAAYQSGEATASEVERLIDAAEAGLEAAIVPIDATPVASGELPERLRNNTEALQRAMQPQQ